MIRTAHLFMTVFTMCLGSRIHAGLKLPLAAPVAIGPPAVVASSSQYFERTFNRLIAEPPVLTAPIVPIAPARPVFAIQPVPKATETSPTTPTQVVNSQGQPNVAIAVATAFAAAPVATILLPPFPFGLPPNIGSAPAETEKPKVRDPEPTTSTERTPHMSQPGNTTPQSSNLENFGQGLTSNQNMDFNQYFAPPIQQIPLEQTPVKHTKPIKLKTSVEIVPVPLQYIAPPPIKAQTIKHIHTFIPTKARIIIRPVYHKPARLIIYKKPFSAKNMLKRLPEIKSRRSNDRDVEPTTFMPLNKPFTKPPRQ